MCDFEMPPNVDSKVHCITIIVVLVGLQKEYIRFGCSANKSFMEDNFFLIETIMAFVTLSTILKMNVK